VTEQLNPRARQFLLIQQALRIARQQVERRLAPDYTSWQAARLERLQRAPGAAARAVASVQRIAGADPYNSARGLAR
jgi:hypothetical protein